MVTGLLLVIAVALIWIWVDMPKSEPKYDGDAYLDDIFRPSLRFRLFKLAVSVSILAAFAAAGWAIISLI